MKCIVILFFSGLLAIGGPAKDVRAEMQRAVELGKKAGSLVAGGNIQPFWSEDGGHFAFRSDAKNGAKNFLQVDLATGEIKSAFDHDQLAKALAATTTQSVDPRHLPLEDIEIVADGTVLLRAFGKSWSFDTTNGELTATEFPAKESELLSPEEARRRTGRSGPSSAVTIENATDHEIEIFWLSGRNERKSYGSIAPGESVTQQTYSGHVWLITRAGGDPLAGVQAADTPLFARVTGRVAAPPRDRPDVSPDGKWRAVIRERNLYLEPTAGGDAVALTSDGAAEDSFTEPLVWSPDSRKLVAFRVKPVTPRQIPLVQSSPSDQIQPKLRMLDYPKPGDEIEQPFPHLFDIAEQQEIPLDHGLFANPWNISRVAWSADSTEFSFVYNQRGHQVLRIVGVKADSGSARTIFEDTSETFIDYSQKFFIQHLPATQEILWMSERSGYNHIYLLDAESGAIKKQITEGNWNVRNVVEVDETNRQLLLKVMGVTGQDPYHMHFVRINFDGSEFTRLTTSDGNHGVQFSPDGKLLLATWSRVDQPPVSELRRASDGQLIAELGRKDDAALQQTGWSRPERFVAKGRDGTTDIHGVIVRPTDFDPTKSYPIVEDIYAGPHDFFVPKNYSPWSGMNHMAELGFVVVKIDGMGTNWRSKAFHDVCWKNLMDGGFTDRVRWIKAAAATRPWMDTTRVGIFGGSAGGQNAMAGMLTHGDFYKAAVADCGCHDNRMDKIWWNEAWMGWPVDDSYARNSNVTHAGKLTGKLLLIVGELDTNVDPASTMQVVNALQQADKDFEFQPIINANHGAAETPYGKRRRAEFLVRTLQADE